MKILCFGDSNTYGYDPRSYWASRYPSDSRWVDLLARKLDCEAVNEGENGREIPCREDQKTTFRRMLADRMPVDLLIVMLGTNDLLQGNDTETVVRRMECFLESIPLDNCKILLIGPPPMRPGEWVSGQGLIASSIALNRELRTLSERLGTGFADAGEWNIPLAFDGVHFTEKGHNVFADRLAEIIAAINVCEFTDCNRRLT